MTLEHSPTLSLQPGRQSGSQLDGKPVDAVAVKPSIVVLDPLKLRRSCIAHILEEWSTAEGLTINSVAQVTPGSRPEIDQNCRLFVISVGGKSITDADVQHNIQTAKLLFPKVPILIVSDLDYQSEIFEAFRLGAKGFIPTSLDPKIALRACTFILGGGSYYPPSALASANPADSSAPVPDTVANPASPGNPVDVPIPAVPPSSEVQAEGDTAQSPPSVVGRLAMILTERQGQVAHLLKDGLSNKMIARHLGMTEATVKVHVRQIMRKLGVQNRTQVALSITSVSRQTLPGSVDL